MGSIERLERIDCYSLILTASEETAGLPSIHPGTRDGTSVGTAPQRALPGSHGPQWRLYREALNRTPLAHEDWAYRKPALSKSAMRSFNCTKERRPQSHEAGAMLFV